jgi:hypothetical protein
MIQLTNRHFSCAYSVGGLGTFGFLDAVTLILRMGGRQRWEPASRVDVSCAWSVIPLFTIYSLTNLSNIHCYCVLLGFYRAVVHLLYIRLLIINTGHQT